MLGATLQPGFATDLQCLNPFHSELRGAYEFWRSSLFIYVFYDGSVYMSNLKWKHKSIILEMLAVGEKKRGDYSVLQQHRA
jgi:hypothetical protein